MNLKTKLAIAEDDFSKEDIDFETECVSNVFSMLEVKFPSKNIIEYKPLKAKLFEYLKLHK